MHASLHALFVCGGAGLLGLVQNIGNLYFGAIFHSIIVHSLKFFSIIPYCSLSSDSETLLETLLLSAHFIYVPP